MQAIARKSVQSISQLTTVRQQAKERELETNPSFDQQCLEAPEEILGPPGFTCVNP